MCENDPLARVHQKQSTHDLSEWQRRIETVQAILDQSIGSQVHDHLTNYIRTAEAWRVFATSLSTLLTKVEEDEEMGEEVANAFRSGDPRTPIVSALDTSLVAYSAGVGAVVDQTRRIMDKWGDDALKQELQAKVRNMLDTTPGAEFVVKLRTYVLHYLAAPWRCNFRLNKQGSERSLALQIQLDCAALLKMGRWPGEAKRFIEEQGQAIHLLPVINNFSKAEWGITVWVHEVICDYRQPEIQKANDLIRELNMLLGSGPAHEAK